MNILFLFLLGLILTVPCFFRDASAAAPAATEENGYLNDEVLLQELQHADGKAENAQEAELPLVYTEETVGKLIDVANAENSVFRRGKKTALAGIATLLVSLAIFLLQRYLRKPGEELDFLFKKETGAITLTGIGIVLGAVTFGVGMGCLLVSSKLKGEAEKLIMRLLGREFVAYGGTLIRLMSVVIVVGWVLSLPAYFMMVVTTDLLVGLAFVLIGFTYLMRDAKRAISLAKQVYSTGDFVAEGGSKKKEKEGVEDYYKFINKPVLEALKTFIAAEKAREYNVSKSNEKIIKEMESVLADPLFILDEDALNALAQQLEGAKDASAQEQTAASEKATSGKETTTESESE